MELTIATSSKQYPVYIGKDALIRLQEFLESSNYTKILIITDEQVYKIHWETFQLHLPTNKEYVQYIVPSGENAKQIRIYEACLSFALENGLDRKSCIIAFGGGAVGDLAGFVAASFMRGIDFIQVPTTILAHDSAVGGKTGINLPLGKNMVGAFHQPEGVFYFTEFLSTLPKHEILSGFSEVIKHSFLSGPEFLYYLMENIQDVNDIQNHFDVFLKKGIEVKANVVAQDEKEAGIRAHLNLGHTLGHAIEATTGYGKVTHGEAVMTGMIYALYLSRKVLHLQLNISDIEKWIVQLGYKLEIPSGFSFDEAINLMKRDKKSIGNKPRFVLLEKIGVATVVDIDEEVLKEVFTHFLKTTQLVREEN